MTKEKIEKAARDYALDQLGIVGLPGRAEAMKAFMAGARWRIDSMWHKKFTVIPDVGRPALLELKCPDSHKIVYKIDIYSGYEWKGLTHYEYSGLIRFAYIDELLPEKRRKPIEVVKITRKVYKCLDVADKPFTKFSKFREIRERLGLKVQRRCFNCGHRFAEDEDIYLAMFKGTLNHFLCKNCTDKALNDLRKEETK